MYSSQQPTILRPLLLQRTELSSQFSYQYVGFVIRIVIRKRYMFDSDARTGSLKTGHFQTV